MPCRSVIYLSRGVAAGLQQSTPRQRTSNPCSAGILDLATHRMYAKECLQTSRWALTPPFHPYPLPHRAFGRSFSVTLSLPSPTAFRYKICCSVLPGLSSCRYVAASDRPRFCMIMLIQFWISVLGEIFSLLFAAPICMNPLMAYTIRHMPVITVTMFSIPLGPKKITAMPAIKVNQGIT